MNSLEESKKNEMNEINEIKEEEQQPSEVIKDEEEENDNNLVVDEFNDENSEMIENDDDESNDYCEDDYYGDYDNGDYLEVEDELNRQNSENKPYKICEKETLLKEISKEVSHFAVITAFSYGWSFQLCYEGQFNEDFINNILDGRHKNLIRYIEGYSLNNKLTSGECEVCMCEGPIYSNACGHWYCMNCWKEYLQANLTDRSLYELMPKCQDEDCDQKMHYELIEAILDSDNSLKEKFNNLLCSNYCRQSKLVKMCTANKCGSIIYIKQEFSERILVCDCKNWICKLCGKESHIPVDCSDKKNWEKIVVNHKNSWLNMIESKPCPFCKEPIIKNGGCNHMSCQYPSCKKQFCWICLKNWQGHTDMGCSNANREWEKEKEKISQNLSKYIEKIEEKKSACEAYENRISKIRETDTAEIKAFFANNFKLLKTEFDFLDDIVDILPKAWMYCKWVHVSIFFERETDQLHEAHLQALEKMTMVLDDLIRVTIPSIQEKYLWQKENIEEKINIQEYINQIFEEKNKILTIKTELIEFVRRLVF